jgi:hypothetical protein
MAEVGHRAERRQAGPRRRTAYQLDMQIGVVDRSTQLGVGTEFVRWDYDRSFSR